MNTLFTKLREQIVWERGDLRQTFYIICHWMQRNQ